MSVGASVLSKSFPSFTQDVVVFSNAGVTAVTILVHSLSKVLLNPMGL